MSRRRPRAARGFTLIEVLLATTLLAAGMALAFAIVRSTLAISTRGEIIAAQNERMRGVEGFLRRRLSSAMPLPLPKPDTDPTAQAFVFDGQPQQMRFVADIPSYLGRGGPYVHSLEVSGEGETRELRIGLTLLQNGQLVLENPPRGSELLVDGLKQVRLRYRGINPQNGGLGDWQDNWEQPGRMPLLVAIDITPAQGAPWPQLVVSVPQYGALPGQWR